MGKSFRKSKGDGGKKLKKTKATKATKSTKAATKPATSTPATTSAVDREEEQQLENEEILPEAPPPLPSDDSDSNSDVELPAVLNGESASVSSSDLKQHNEEDAAATSTDPSVTATRREESDDDASFASVAVAADDDVSVTAMEATGSSETAAAPNSIAFDSGSAAMTAEPSDDSEAPARARARERELLRKQSVIDAASIEKLDGDSKAETDPELEQIEIEIARRRAERARRRRQLEEEEAAEALRREERRRARRATREAIELLTTSSTGPTMPEEGAVADPNRSISIAGAALNEPPEEHAVQIINDGVRSGKVDDIKATEIGSFAKDAVGSNQPSKEPIEAPTSSPTKAASKETSEAPRSSSTKAASKEPSETSRSSPPKAASKVSAVLVRSNSTILSRLAFFESRLAPAVAANFSRSSQEPTTSRSTAAPVPTAHRRTVSADETEIDVHRPEESQEPATLPIPTREITPSSIGVKSILAALKEREQQARDAEAVLRGERRTAAIGSQPAVIAKPSSADMASSVSIAKPTAVDDAQVKADSSRNVENSNVAIGAAEVSELPSITKTSNSPSDTIGASALPLNFEGDVSKRPTVRALSNRLGRSSSSRVFGEATKKTDKGKDLDDSELRRDLDRTADFSISRPMQIDEVPGMKKQDKKAKKFHVLTIRREDTGAPEPTTAPELPPPKSTKSSKKAKKTKKAKRVEIRRDDDVGGPVRPRTQTLGDAAAVNKSRSNTMSANDADSSSADFKATLDDLKNGTDISKASKSKAHKGGKYATVNISAMANNDNTTTRRSVTEVVGIESPVRTPEPGRVYRDSHPRLRVLRELIETEKDYISDLEVMNRLFVNPIREKKILTAGEINAVFSNVDVLLKIHSELLKKFDADESDSIEDMMFGEIFIRLAPFLNIYTVYCSANETQNARVEELRRSKPLFKELLAHAHKYEADCRQLDLESFLIKPVQRICKYPLLFRELIKYTPEDHKDRPNLVQLYDNVTKIVSKINEQRRASDNATKMQELRDAIEEWECPEFEIIIPDRRYLREGSVSLVTSRSGKSSPGQLFLFSDCLMFLKNPRKTLRGRMGFTVVGKVDLRAPRSHVVGVVKQNEALKTGSKDYPNQGDESDMNYRRPRVFASIQRGKDISDDKLDVCSTKRGERFRFLFNENTMTKTQNAFDKKTLDAAGGKKTAKQSVRYIRDEWIAAINDVVEHQWGLKDGTSSDEDKTVTENDDSESPRHADPDEGLSSFADQAVSSKERQEGRRRNRKSRKVDAAQQ